MLYNWLDLTQMEWLLSWVGLGVLDMRIKTKITASHTLNEKTNKQTQTRSYFHHCSSSVFIRSSNIWLSYIHIPLLLYFTGLFGTKKIPALSWLVSSVGRALDWYRRGHGFKSHTGLNFFSGLIFTTAQVLFITAKIGFILTSLSPVQIYDFHIFTVI